MKTVSESIFNNKNIVIPMADVSHIETAYIEDEAKMYNYQKLEGLKKGDLGMITVVMKGTTYNSDQSEYNNAIYIHGKKAHKFMKAWCMYRHELEQDTLMDLTLSHQCLMSIAGSGGGQVSRNYHLLIETHGR